MSSSKRGNRLSGYVPDYVVFDLETTGLSPNTDEIIENLRPHIANISPRTYYRKRPEAVQALSSILWGYTSKGCLEMLDKFFPEGK